MGVHLRCQDQRLANYNISFVSFCLVPARCIPPIIDLVDVMLASGMYKYTQDYWTTFC